MENAGPWRMPLWLLPGVALLLMSTTARYAQISRRERHEKIDGDKGR